MDVQLAQINDLIFDPNTYLHKDPASLDKTFRHVVSGIPCSPVDVDANMRIIGGHEQWIAALRARKNTVTISIHQHIKSDTDAMLFACRQSAGSLTGTERRTAVSLVLGTIQDREQRLSVKATLQDLLGMTQREINKATIHISDGTDDPGDDRIIELFLNGRSVAEISRELDISKYYVLKTLTSAGLYVTRSRKTTECLAQPSDKTQSFDETIGNQLDKAISQDGNEIELLLEMMEGTTASLNDEYAKYGITLENYNQNRKTAQREANKACKSIVMLMEQLQSTIPVLRDPRMTQTLLMDIEPLTAVTGEFVKAINDYKAKYAESNTPSSLIKQHFMNIIKQAGNQQASM